MLVSVDPAHDCNWECRCLLMLHMKLGAVSAGVCNLGSVLLLCLSCVVTGTSAGGLILCVVVAAAVR